MKQTVLLSSLALYLLMSICSGCTTNVDLQNIDPSVQASMKLALPVGDISAKIGDFIGNENISQYIKVDKSGLLIYQDTFKLTRNFYDIDLTKYITSAHQKFNIGEIYGGLPLQEGVEYQLHFPLHIELSNINAANLDGTYNERIDSVWIREAQFTSNFRVADFPIPYTDIKKLEIVLDNNFSRQQGSVIEVPLEGFNYNTNIPIIVDEFTLNLMKDRNADPSNLNVLNEVNFEFVFTIVPSSDMIVSTNASINYDFNINFLQYHAIWGWFKPSNQMHGSDTIILADEWPTWKEFQRFMLPFSEPRIILDVYNSIGMPLMIDGDYLFVESAETGEKQYAQFDGLNTWTWPLQNFVHLDDDINTIVKNTYVFSADPSKGAIDKLFVVRPDFIGYSYKVYPNNSKAEANGIKHYRLSENTTIDVDAIVHIPFTFNEGVSLAYTDTINNINIKEYQLDSLLNEVEFIEDAEVHTLKLVLQITNTIPFDIDGTFTFFDEDEQEIELDITETGNTLHIERPTDIENGVIMEPGKSTIIVDITQEEYDKLVNLRTIIFTASLGDNTTYVRLLDQSDLNIRIAVAANVTADFNLDYLFNSNGEGEL